MGRTVESQDLLLALGRTLQNFCVLQFENIEGLPAEEQKPHLIKELTVTSKLAADILASHVLYQTTVYNFDK